MKLWRAIVDAYRRHKAQQVRTIPHYYFRGYRRLAQTRAQIDELSDELGQECSTCRHAVAHVTWHCDRQDGGCAWQPCYVADELTRADLRAGQLLAGGWIGLPAPSATNREATTMMERNDS